MSVRTGYSQDSKRSTLIIKCEQAAAEVEQSRTYITELEAQLRRTDSQIFRMETEATTTKAELEAKKTEALELRDAIESLKAANTERIKEIAKMQKKIDRLEGQVSFWRKVAIGAVILAAGSAAVILNE